MATEALSIMGDEPSPERARALSLALQHGDAVLMWKGLIQSQPNHAGHWTGLARALEQAGDLETAQKCHAKAAAMNGESPTPQPMQPAPSAPAPAPPPTAPAPPPVEIQPAAPAQSAALDLLTTPLEAPPAPASVPDEQLTSTAALLLEPVAATTVVRQEEAKPEVDLAKAALDAAQAVANHTPQSTTSNAIANQDVAWFNQGVQLIDDKKYKEALSCFDKALPAFAGDDAMIIRILNNRGNAYYFLEEYPKCVESYHQAMLIRPTEVRGETLYNMGTAYAEMERYKDAIKCFEQAMPRGLSDEAKRRAKDQIRRCNILQKAVDKKRKKR